MVGWVVCWLAVCFWLCRDVRVSRGHRNSPSHVCVMLEANDACQGGRLLEAGAKGCVQHVRRRKNRSKEIACRSQNIIKMQCRPNQGSNKRAINKV